MILRGFTDLVVTGTSVDSGYDYFTIKYNPATGDSVWGARYNGNGLGNDIARAIIVRTSSEVYLTGSSQSDSGDYDYLTIRYNGTTGVPVWISRYDGGVNGNDHAYALSLQSSSRVFVTGKSVQPGSFNDIGTVRYNQNNGAEGWVADYNGTANDDDGGIATVGGGSPYVLGYASNAGVGRDFAILQYNGSNGSLGTNFVYNGTGNSTDAPAAIAASGSAVYVCGSSKATPKGSDFITIKYNDPAQLKYRSFVQDSLLIKAVNLKLAGTVANNGNVRDETFNRAYPKIKAGFPGAPGGLVIGNARPDSATAYGWIRIDKGTAAAQFLPHHMIARGFDAYATSVFVGEKKNPKVTKFDDHLVGELLALRVAIGASDAEITPPTFGELTYNDGDTSNHFNGLTLRQLATTIDNYLTYWRKYPAINWNQLDSTVSRVNRAFVGKVRVVATQPLVVTGAVLIDSVTFLQAAAATPAPQPLAFAPNSIIETTDPERYTLYQNYPNPFNPSTTIMFDLPKDALVTLKIYNVLGQEVATLLDSEPLDLGDHEVQFDARMLASGTYFYRIIANNGEFQQIRKMLLLK
jgi:hypothetical protein